MFFLLFSCVIIVVAITVFVVVIVVLWYDFCFVILLTKQDGGNKNNEKGGAKKWNNFPVTKGAIMFPNMKIMVSFMRFVCFFKNTMKIGVSVNFGHCLFFFCDLGVQKVGSNKGSTVGSVSGPHFGSNC